MSEYLHTGLEVVGKHEPDYSVEDAGDGTKYRVELPGHYTVGVLVDGVFVPLLRRKASGLFADIERRKRAQDAATPPPPPQPPAA